MVESTWHEPTKNPKMAMPCAADAGPLRWWTPCGARATRTRWQSPCAVDAAYRNIPRWWRAGAACGGGDAMLGTQAKWLEEEQLLFRLPSPAVLVHHAIGARVPPHRGHQMHLHSLHVSPDSPVVSAQRLELPKQRLQEPFAIFPMPRIVMEVLGPPPPPADWYSPGPLTIARP